ncbi:MAG: HAD family hydrolase [Clostridia bacterium]
MNKGKLIIFDWGGVIESHRVGESNIFSAIIRVMKRMECKFNDEIMIQKYNNSSNNGVVIGTINDICEVKKWYEIIKEDFGISKTFNEFVSVYEEEFSKVYYYKEVIELINAIKDKCQLGILSNLIYIDKNRLDSQVNLSRFDYVWLSFELGYIKPQEEIYKIVENDCQINANNILFIDDSRDNILMAKKRGWCTCQSYGYELDIIKKSVVDFLDK